MLIFDILFCLGIGGALIAACYGIAYAAVRGSEIQRPDTFGDWPFQPEVFPPQHDEGCSQ